MKKQYKRPQLVEYGTLQQLTLGQTGNSPDWAIVYGVMINNNCNSGVPTQGIQCS